MKNSAFLRISALCMALCMLCSCGAALPADSGTAVNANELALQLQSQYAANSNVNYTEPEYDLARNAAYTYEIGFDTEENGIRLTSEIVGVYLDAALTQSANMASDVELLDGGRTQITLKPGRAPTYALPTTYTLNGREYLLGDQYAYHMYDLGEFADWGNAPQYYRVQWLDLETGEKLDKPVVTVFTIQHALAAPDAEFYVTANGDAALRWNAVEGADRYYVCEASFQDGSYSYTSVIGVTADTGWQYDNGDIASVMNSPFKTAFTTQDDRLSSYYSPENEYVSKYETCSTYFVIAANDKDSSAASACIKDSAIDSQLPYSRALNTQSQDEEYTTRPASIGLLPAQAPITMCDGTTQYRVLNYNMARAEIKMYQNVEWPDGEEMTADNMTVTDVPMLVVPFTVDSTLFTGKAAIENFDENTWKKELEAVAARQESLRGRTGDVSAVFSSGGASLGHGTDVKDKTTVFTKNDTVSFTPFGSTALCAYLGTCMMQGAGYIPLSAFPEASDMTVLADAWNEAVYQNPLILGASGASFDSRNNALLVEYDNADTMAAKQTEIEKAVAKIVAQIITDDMTDLEKEMAINQYLCDSAEYDYDALANAEQYDYATVDAQFDDSFTAYGILIKKVGVCASYAASFKLLADAAGLESIVVTGYLNGSLPHAWNRVLIDGEWKTVDVTNNDNPDLFNALFNLPDNAAVLALAEDDRYMMNDALAQYTASEDAAEYYRIENKYYAADDIAPALAAELAENGTAVLRTEYNLDDDTFQNIAQQVMTLMNKDSLYGYYWMGVIHFSLKN